MAEDITFVHFRYGTYAEINNSANNRTLNPHAVYIATDKQLMYAKGAWIGVTSVTSEVNQDTGEITLKFNYDSEGQPTGNPITCPIKGAGMTTEQKAQLETAYKFAIDVGGTSADDIINKWQEVVDFLAGIEGGTLEGIVATKADKNTTIIAGDGLTGGGDLSENRTIKVESADDGITVNSDNIQLNTVDNLTTSSKTKPLSANQGKVLDGKVKSVADLLNDMFEKVTKNGKTYIKTKYGFASDKFVSAGGTDDTESGGSGGVNLTQMWESLQGNSDTFANTKINKAHIPTLDVDHIPTLTTGKISDFVSATQAIADTAVANKADKATTIQGYRLWEGYTDLNDAPMGAFFSGGKNVANSPYSEDYISGITLARDMNSGYRTQLSFASTRIFIRQERGANKWDSWHEVAFKETTLSGYGITDAVTLNTDQTISGKKTFSKLKVSNTNLVTNLNAEMVDGTPLNKLFAERGQIPWNDDEVYDYNKALIAGSYNTISSLSTSRDIVNAPFDNYGTLLYGTGNGDTWMQLAAEYSRTSLYVRSGNIRNSEVFLATDWKEVAFMDSNVASAQTLKHSNGKVGAIVAEDGRLEKVASLYNIYGVGVKIAQGTVPTSVGDLSPAVVFGIQDAIQSRYGTAIWGTSDGKGHIQVGRLDKTATAYSLCLQEFGGNVGIGTVDPTAKLHVNGDSIIDGKLTVATGALKIVDANLSYDLGTLIVDKSLKAIGTMSATQGEFANYIKIGNATISWNPKGYLEINEGLASQKFISAGGVVTGDAGSGGGGLSLTDMWVSLNGNIDAYGKSKIHIDHIPLDIILSHDDYENDVADRINTFNYSNSSSFTSAVKALIVANNIPTLEMSKINGLEDTLTDIGTVVQSNYETLNTLITNNHKDHEARIKAIEQALTWQTV